MFEFPENECLGFRVDCGLKRIRVGAVRGVAGGERLVEVIGFALQAGRGIQFLGMVVSFAGGVSGIVRLSDFDELLS